MLGEVLGGWLVFMLGLSAGILIKIIVENIAKNTREQMREPGPESLTFKINWSSFVPLLTALLTLLTWLLPVYRQAPFYIFAGNIGLIWLLILVGLVDYFTRLIYPRMLLVGAGLLAAPILVTITFFGAVVGLIVDNATDSIRAVKANELSERNFASFVQLWPLGILDSLAGMIVAGVAFGCLYFLSRLAHQEAAFGSGDVLLAVFIGLFLGFQRSIVWAGLSATVSLVALCILLVSKRGRMNKNQVIAFGPFLVGGAIICLMFGWVIKP